MFFEFLHATSGARAVDDFNEWIERSRSRWYLASAAERLSLRIARPIWWHFPADTNQRATVMLPRKLHQELPELGIDFAFVFPTLGLLFQYLPDPDLHCAAARAYNAMVAELFRGLGDRIVAVPVLPNCSPTDALEELDRLATTRPGAAVLGGWRTGGAGVESVALDCSDDFDPLWARAAQLGVALVNHAGGSGWEDRRSSSSFVFNHIGHFANANHHMCKAIVLGGVASRHPRLRVAFLEGGVGWAYLLLLDLVRHWNTRNREITRQLLDPRLVDPSALEREICKHGDPRTVAYAERLAQHPDPFHSHLDAAALFERDKSSDDFPFTARLDDLVAPFREQFFFGCEADDPAIALAYERSLPVQLRPVFGSDIGHFDVTDIHGVVAKALELLEDSVLASEEFRALTFENCVAMYTVNRPDFFDGTAIERAARDVIAGPTSH